MLTKMMVASVFCLCFCGVSNAQPGVAQKTAVDAVLDAAKEWRREKVEVGRDKGPVVEESFTPGRDRGCTPSDRGPIDRGPRERDPIDRGPIDRGPRERDPIDRGPIDRGPRERDPIDRGPIDRGPRERDPIDRGPIDRGPRERDRDKPVGSKKDIS